MLGLGACSVRHLDDHVGLKASLLGIWDGPVSWKRRSFLQYLTVLLAVWYANR